MEWCCDMCMHWDNCDNLIYLNKIPNYLDSNLVYCQRCWSKRQTEYLCERCGLNIQGFTCTKDNGFDYVCYLCKCNECEYCIDLSATTEC